MINTSRQAAVCNRNRLNYASNSMTSTNSKDCKLLCVLVCQRVRNVLCRSVCVASTILCCSHVTFNAHATQHAQNMLPLNKALQTLSATNRSHNKPLQHQTQTHLFACASLHVPICVHSVWEESGKSVPTSICKSWPSIGQSIESVIGGPRWILCEVSVSSQWGLSEFPVSSGKF